MTFKAQLYQFLYPFHKVYRYIFRPKTNGAACVVQCDNKFLLVRNTYGAMLWSFPGGGVKRGESFADAAIRETKEEVGIELAEVKELGNFLYTGFYHHDTVYAFYAMIKNNHFKIDPNEILKAKWFSLDEIPREKLSDIGLEILNLLISFKK